MSQLTLLTVIAPSIKNRCRKWTSSVPSAYGPFLPFLSKGVLWLCCPQDPKRGGNWMQDSGSARVGFALSAPDLGAGADCWSQTPAWAARAAVPERYSGPSNDSQLRLWFWRTLMCLGPVFPFSHKNPSSLISAEVGKLCFSCPFITSESLQYSNCCCSQNLFLCLSLDMTEEQLWNRYISISSLTSRAAAFTDQDIQTSTSI